MLIRHLDIIIYIVQFVILTLDRISLLSQLGVCPARQLKFAKISLSASQPRKLQQKLCLGHESTYFSHRL
jgi:hypothetical protein